MSDNSKVDTKGILGWMASNSVASNLLMFILIIGGIIYVDRVKWEVFPQFELEMVLINVPYPGAAPEEVESGVIELIEDRIQDIEGIDQMGAAAAEGYAVNRSRPSR